jgi:hypothetical protein
LLLAAREIRYQAFADDPEVDVFDEVLAVSRLLQVQVDNPAHYGENLPGYFIEERLIPGSDRFTCAELVNYGPSGEHGLAGFYRACGLPETTSEKVMYLAAALAVIDEALLEFERGNDHFAMELAVQALDLANEARMAHFAPAIEQGKKFIQGRKPGAVGIVKRTVQTVLKRHPNFGAAEVWASIVAKPPKGMSLYDTGRFGKYIETGSPLVTTGYARFCNIVSEEKKAMKGSDSRNSEPVKPRK